MCRDVEGVAGCLFLLRNLPLSPPLGFGPGFGKRQESQPLTVAPARARVAPSPPLAAGRTGPRLGAARGRPQGWGGPVRMDSVRVVGLMNGRAAPPGGAPAGVRLRLGHVELDSGGYFAGMVSVHKWSMYFHTPWGVHDHLRSITHVCVHAPLAAIVPQSHQLFKRKN